MTSKMNCNTQKGSDQDNAASISSVTSPSSSTTTSMTSSSSFWPKNETSPASGASAGKPVIAATNPFRPQPGPPPAVAPRNLQKVQKGAPQARKTNVIETKGDANMNRESSSTSQPSQNGSHPMDTRSNVDSSNESNEVQFPVDESLFSFPSTGDLIAQASLEVQTGDSDINRPVQNVNSVTGGAGLSQSSTCQIERRLLVSLDEALRSRRMKMAEQLDCQASQTSDEESLNEQPDQVNTGSDLDEELVSSSPTGFLYNPIQLPPRSSSKPIIRPKSESSMFCQQQPIYVNLPITPHIPSSTPPFPSPNEDPVRYLSDHWAEYRAADSGRPYYYNYVTGDHSWKPPRRKFSSSQQSNRLNISVKNDKITNSMNNTLDSSVEGIPSPPPSPTEQTPSGWSKVYDDISGSMYYINEISNEKWCSNYDNEGRIYFYKEGSQMTSWELPKVAPQPPQRAHKVAKSQDDSSISKTKTESDYEPQTILRTTTLPSGAIRPNPSSRNSSSPSSMTASVYSSSSHNVAKLNQTGPSTPVASLLHSKSVTASLSNSNLCSSGSGGDTVASVSGGGSSHPGHNRHPSQYQDVHYKAQPAPQTTLRSLSTRSMILSELDWRSKSVDIIHGLQQNSSSPSPGSGGHPGSGTSGGQFSYATGSSGAHVLSVTKLGNINDIEETIKRQGTLNKADLVKAGKKVQKKNWMGCFLALTSKNLYIYKDAQSGQQAVLGENALARLALPGALIEWCPDKSKRKNCFQVSTVQGQKMLFQDDSAQTSREWFESIKGCIIHLPLGYDISGEILNARLSGSHVGASGTGTPTNSASQSSKDFSVGSLTKDTLKRSKKVLRSKSIKLLRPSNTLPTGSSTGSGLGLASSEVTLLSASGSTQDLVTLSPNERKRRIGDRLKQFFMRRPTLEMLKEKGIIKDEPVFGCSLASLCQREKCDVPRFVVQCINAIENKDMRADGIYRASGNLSQVQKVRFGINNDDYSVLEKEDDVHVLTGALKMFFRELKEPVIPFGMFDPLLQATTIQDRVTKLKTFESILKELPHVNRETLRYLFEHLLRVKEYSSENRMHIQNLAIVFGPTLLYSADQSIRNIALDTIQQNQVIEFLLVEFDMLFA